MSEREKLAVEKFNKLYKDSKIPENIANSDLYNIVNNLVYGEIYQQGQLTDKDRELISLVALTTLGTNTLLKTMTCVIVKILIYAIIKEIESTAYSAVYKRGV